MPLITLLTILPVVGAIVLFCVPSDRAVLGRRIALPFSLAGLGAVLGMWNGFDPAITGLQFVERYPWIPSLSLHVDYLVGVDGLGLLMLLLTALVTPMAILASWKIETHASRYFALVLLLESGLFGAFTALNFFHWFLFWELSLIPAFFLIKLWGGPRRSHAATLFFVYTMAGSVALLVAFVPLGVAAGSFDFFTLAERAKIGQLIPSVYEKVGWHGLRPNHLGLLLFIGVFLGFAVKVPIVPFHTWSPITYSEAPTGTVVLLTGAMSKMGVYGFIRILMPLFPEQSRALATPLLALAVLSIVYSAFAAFAQKDLKRLLAYSSINHLGYCMLGIFASINGSASGAFLLDNERAAALNGVLLQMFNHGITASALFCCLGFLEQRSGGLRRLDDFGGLRKVAPVFCGLMGISLLASLGLPGLNGFIGELLIFKGAFSLASWAAVFSLLGLLMTAVFLLTLLQRIFTGPLSPEWSKFPDLTAFERLILAPAVALMFVLGIYPQLVVGVINNSVMAMVAQLVF